MTVVVFGGLGVAYGCCGFFARKRIQSRQSAAALLLHSLVISPELSGHFAVLKDVQFWLSLIYTSIGTQAAATSGMCLKSAWEIKVTFGDT